MTEVGNAFSVRDESFPLAHFVRGAEAQRDKIILSFEFLVVNYLRLIAFIKNSGRKGGRSYILTILCQLVAQGPSFALI